MSCSSCLRDVKIVGRGYCRACYQRWHKRGSTDYAPKRVRAFCQIDDCGKPVHGNGLCGMHYGRLAKHGSADPTGWGAQHKHPLKHSWQWFMRYRSQRPVDPRWEDFLQFVMDVGERPTRKHKLFAANDTLPLGPDNFVWKESVTQRAQGEDEKTYMNRAQKVYRAVRKEAFQGYELKRRSGISLVEFGEMTERQSGLCAICLEPERAVIPRTGMPRQLAVDHCHTGGQIRALLYSLCNTGLGSFRDNPDLMRAAIAYLEKHTLPVAIE